MNWQKMAERAIEEGYEPGNRYEQVLRKSLPQEKVEQLGSELEAYLQVQVADAMKLAEDLMEQGTPPETAMELAIHQLLEVAT